MPPWSHRFNRFQCVNRSDLLTTTDNFILVTTIRAIGQRAHPMHLLAVFATQSVIAATILYVWVVAPLVPTNVEHGPEA